MRLATVANRFSLLMAGVLGATGIGLSAAVSHMANPEGLSAAATVCLASAPALVALYSGQDKIRLSALAALMIAVGAGLFTSDMLLRHFYGEKLFSMAAPTGGVTMIAGWVVVISAAIIPRRQA